MQTDNACDQNHTVQLTTWTLKKSRSHFLLKWCWNLKHVLSRLLIMWHSVAPVWNNETRPFITFHPVCFPLSFPGHNQLWRLYTWKSKNWKSSHGSLILSYTVTNKCTTPPQKKSYVYMHLMIRNTQRSIKPVAQNEDIEAQPQGWSCVAFQTLFFVGPIILSHCHVLGT